MALTDIFGWNKEKDAQEKEQTSAACGTACGAGDEATEKPAACGTACGASDK